MSERRAPPAIPDHRLLRRIGRGSYGDVWLAQSALGELRAVKVVHRAAFDHDRPYEREFTGLRNFEPLSRQHDGFVDILHVGRDDAAGCFYYVMELADDANAPTHQPGTASPSPDLTARPYRPLTLETHILAAGRLSAAESAQIALRLAEALDCLHRAGLVHRDVKPANIIFVGGAPKLADVGLVTQTGSGRSFVGTEGYIPREGPGTPRADVFSLGKCLYEMAMGKDRCAFPSPPTTLDTLPDQRELNELNEVITTACAPEPQDRHPTAAAMAAELRHLLAGQSVRQARQRAAWRRRAVWSAAAVLAVAAALFGSRLLSRETTPQFTAAASAGGSRPVEPEPDVPSKPSLQIVREFALPGNWPASGALVGDYDACGQPELIAGRDGHLILFSLDRRLLSQGRVPQFRGSDFTPTLLADAEGNACPEIFTSWQDGTNLFISVFNQVPAEIRRFHGQGSLWFPKVPAPTNILASASNSIDPPPANATSRSAEPHPASAMHAVAFLPADANGPARVLATVSSGYAIWPRGLWAYSYETGERLWDLPLAAGAITVIVRDINNNGTSEILIGCYSSDNRARLPNGETDSRTSLRVVAGDGKPLWHREVGGAYMRCFVHPIRVGGSLFLYALVVRNEEAHRQDKRQLPVESHVIKFDTAGNELARYSAEVEFNGLVSADLPDHQRPRFFTGDSRGCLHELDADLNPVRVVRVMENSHDWVSLRVETIADLDADDQLEILLQGTAVEFVSGISKGQPHDEANFRHYHRHRLLVLDSNLEIKVEHLLTEFAKADPRLRIHVLPLAPRGCRPIVAVGQQVALLQFR